MLLQSYNQEGEMYERQQSHLCLSALLLAH